MIQQIVHQLEAHASVHDWRVEQNHKRSHQLFLVGEDVECIRTVETTRATVSIYNDHEDLQGSAARGDSSFVVLPQDETSAISEKLDDAVFMAGLVSNPPYGLPGPSPYPTVDVLDQELAQHADRVIQTLREDLIEAVSLEPQIRLSSAEMFLDVGDSLLRNSRGIEASVRSSQILFDFVLTSNDGTKETEMHLELQRRRSGDLGISELVARKAAEARDALLARAPAGHRGPVVVSREALLDMLEFFRIQTSAQSKIQKLTQLQPDQSVFGDRELAGEPFSLRSNALLPYGTLSGSFDADGLPGRDVALIEDNVLRSFWAGQRYAEYLDIEPTGACANMVVPAGATSMADLLSDGPVVHIVAFSDMMPNPVTGDVVAEIRLGYEINGEKRTSIKGGALSTNLFDAFAKALYSSETTFLGNYLGPVAIRFDGMTISGG